MIGKLLGIDHGVVRIGLAVSDPLGLVARELTIIKRKSKQEDFRRINHIAAEQRVVGIVIGLPYNPDAPPGAHLQSDTVLRWVDQFKATTSLPIILWDEQMSSYDAVEISKRRKRRYDEPIDDLAARVILQSYLDAVRDGLAPPPDLGASLPDQEN
jgi:putative Holliday junction resolvase